MIECSHQRRQFKDSPSTAPDETNDTRWPYEGSALRWRQGCCCSSLLIRPCRCIKPKRSGQPRSPHPPPPAPSPNNTQPASATEHSTTCNLHWSQSASHRPQHAGPRHSPHLKTLSSPLYRPCLLCKSRCCLAKYFRAPKVARLDFDARIP